MATGTPVSLNRALPPTLNPAFAASPKSPMGIDAPACTPNDQGFAGICAIALDAMTATAATAPNTFCFVNMLTSGMRTLSLELSAANDDNRSVSRASRYKYRHILAQVAVLRRDRHHSLLSPKGQTAAFGP